MPSSVIAEIDYEREHSRLTVTFVSGRVYAYYLVPPREAAEFRAASSKGTYFNTHIRDRYVCRDMTPRSVQLKRSAR